jgi:hypothetical protein
MSVRDESGQIRIVWLLLAITALMVIGVTIGFI